MRAAGQGLQQATWLAGLAVAPPRLQTVGEAAKQGKERAGVSRAQHSAREEKHEHTPALVL